MDWLHWTMGVLAGGLLLYWLIDAWQKHRGHKANVTRIRAMRDTLRERQ